MTLPEAVLFSDGGKVLPVCECFYSLQCEGYHTGRAALFLRLSGCDVGCAWCDTKHSWSVKQSEFISIEYIVDRVCEYRADCVVITGGEPTLYNLDPLIDLLHNRNILAHIETSGSGVVSDKIDWVALSPKTSKESLAENFIKADELKVVIGEEDDFCIAEAYRTQVSDDCRCYLQPQWGKKDFLNNIIEYIKDKKTWRLSLQVHKYINID